MEHGMAQFVRQRETAQQWRKIATQPDKMFLRVQIPKCAFWLIVRMKRFDFEVEPPRNLMKWRAIIPPLWVTCVKTSQKVPGPRSCFKLYALFHKSTLFLIVILSEAKNLTVHRARFFASLRMTMPFLVLQILYHVSVAFMFFLLLTDVVKGEAIHMIPDVWYNQIH